MGIYTLELKKLYSSIAVWGLIVLFSAFNIFLVLSGSWDEYPNFVAKVSHQTGYILNDNFYDKLSQVQVDVMRTNTEVVTEANMGVSMDANTEVDAGTEYLQQFMSDVQQIEDVFDGYDIKDVGEKYITAVNMPERFAEIMRSKYADLQVVVDQTAASDQSLTLYFAGGTYDIHQLLFKNLTGWLVVEGVILAALLVLLSLGYENSNRTESIVYSTKTGRHILRTKFAAAISAGLGAYLLLAVTTFAVYFNVNDYGGIWGSSVSSAFNYRYDLIAGIRPFVTWHSYSVVTYFLVTIGMSVGLIFCFSLMAFAIGIVIKNNYLSFFVFLIVNAVMIAIPITIQGNALTGYYIKYYSMLSPVWLWLKHSLWFTDGDFDILWKYFEIRGLAVSTLFFIAIGILAVYSFGRRDIV